jgi:hypothetical protein
MRVPTATELLHETGVQQALEQAWLDSRSDDPAWRHEEGGWIYLNPVTGQITVRRAASGEQASIDLSNPPIIPDSFVVGKFHTHPHPTADGWEAGPSETDRHTDEVHGVPDLIRADDGIHVSGPSHRGAG